MPKVARLAVVFAAAVLLAFGCRTETNSGGPVDFGRKAVDAALAARGLEASVEIGVTGEGIPESFVVDVAGGSASIRGADPNGAMYGALELAERIRRTGAAALSGPPVEGSPFLRERGLNLFLTLPWDYAKDDTDYDPLALTDPRRWWFADDGFWRSLLGEMALARLNWLDIHGTWDISVTDAPNLYAYFIQSDRFPKVGVAPGIKAANLRQLNKVIAMAHDRGIRVSLMAYEASFHTPHAPAPYPENEADLYAYTREMVEKMIRLAPGLDAIGFRIGESGHGEKFFSSYIEAVAASGRAIPLITRSWLARKSRVVPLAAAAGDFTVEIKYNGEQWGAPYMLMGGRMAGWYSYSFEDYLSDSSAGGAVRLWPGNPAPGGETWPAEPYKLVWQVRANGTHRILPVYDPDAVRRAVKSMPLGTAAGFTVEPLETYYPKSPRYYVAHPANLYCDWTHQRDWMFLNLWGRLGYDPGTPDEVFESLVAEKLGPQAAGPLTRAWSAASRIIQTAFSAFSLGPDHRNHAVELEWGGDTAAYLAGDPFDSHVFKSAREVLADAATGGLDGRIGPVEAASRLEALAQAAAGAADIPPESVPPGERNRLAELVTACTQASRLGRYYAERFMSAYRAGEADDGVPGAAGKAAGHMREAAEEWGALSAEPFYRPFTERLRMRTNAFHWSKELPKIQAEAERLAALAPPADDPIPPLAEEPSLPGLRLEISSETAAVSLDAGGISRAWALVKPLPSSTFFHKFPMALEGDRFAYTFRREVWGHAVAAEVERGGRIDRVPGWDADAPYLVVASKPGPTPLVYSSEEALTYLEPAVLGPAEHGLLLIASKASNFHRSFGIPAERKVLDPVRRGLTLVVLAQDYLGGRYTLDWLPRPLGVKAGRSGVFDPGGLLGMRRIEDSDILRQVFLQSPGWTVSPDGGTAVLPWGRGRIVMINARLLERLHIPACAASLAAVLASGEKGKPVVVIDAGTEGGPYSTSVVTDFLNARGVPFLTLGEVIARSQGAAAEPVAGEVDDDDVLSFRNIRGPQMVNAFLDGKVKAAAALPVPATREEFERRREAQRRELFRSLGLDPFPPRTPLAARVTGVVTRRGYRIEKVVFESRPHFPVTAHLYVPDAPEGTRFPVIVNPHGHWEWKKQEPTVQARLIEQALSGYLAMVIDSPGWSFEGDRRVERRQAGTHDDLRLVLGSENATSVYVWDLMRALDYLETRPEADMTRVGLTGASGGGLATLWAFAADPRFKAAASVVYASSYEVNPNNGCLCNHVPGALQIGDRADVLALRAPAPVLIVGAEEDKEFPAAGMRLSGEKLRRLWGLYGKSKDAWLRMFPGGHDYSRPMRETVLGFFDKYVKRIGAGTPVPEMGRPAEPPDSPDMSVLPEPPARTLTMRDVARGMFDENTEAAARRETGSFADFVGLNGGLPGAVPVEVNELGESEGRRRATFVSESGLTLPAVIWPAEGEARATAVLVSERGKAAAIEEFPVKRLRAAGVTCVAVDPRGIGETRGLDLRLQTYLGQAPAFGMGWDISRAVAAFAPEGLKVAVIGRGPAAGQAAMIAALVEPRVGFVAGLATLRKFADAFGEDIPLIAVQPRANYAPSLSRLRSLVGAESLWGFLGEPEPDWTGALLRWSEK